MTAALELSMIAAIGRNGELGFCNELIWRIPPDLQHFKRSTMHAPLIMGRKTFESLPGILPGRPHIVLSRTMTPQDGVYVSKSVDDVLRLVTTLRDPDGRAQADAWVIGGAEIYALFLPLVRRLYLTRIDAEHRCDARFPELDWTDWTLIESREFERPVDASWPPASLHIYQRAS